MGPQGYFSACLNEPSAEGCCSCGAEAPEVKVVDDSLYHSVSSGGEPHRVRK